MLKSQIEPQQKGCFYFNQIKTAFFNAIEFYLCYYQMN